MAGFAGTVALVTGGGSGIGRTTALAFAREGIRVVVANRHEADGQHTVEQIRAAGGDALFVRTDVTQETEVRALIERVAQAFGRLDYAVNNAGVSQRAVPLVEMTEAEFQQVMDVNVKGVWLCLKYEIPQMLGTGGAIVNMASLAGVVGFPGAAIYAASKHAVIGLTRSAALDYARSGIRVNAICPGFIQGGGALDRFVNGNQATLAQMRSTVPQDRLGTTDDVASAVLYLCSDAAAFMTGQTLVLDGGYTAG
jgi:NAD(P)-dependent dehydrogenase (short-subunit alcohol dehydrogenase family)